MKNFINFISLFLFSSLTFGASCNNDPYSIQFQQINGTATAYLCNALVDIGSNAIAIYDEPTHDLNWISIGSGLNYSKATNTISAVTTKTFNNPSRT